MAISIIEQWAIDHKIGKYALDNLLYRFGVLECQLHTRDGTSRESSLQNQVRLHESRRGTRLFRNNSGVAYDKDGRPVRFGLANDSAQSNRRVKSSDLIGIEPGGRFVSLEVKAPGWIYKGTDREVAQLNWITFVNSMGGRAGFVSSLADYDTV